MAHSHTHHASHHDHGHGHHASGRLLSWSLLLTFGFALVEGLAGWRANSLALLSDAGHMLTDAGALALAAFAAWVAKHPPSPRHSFGLMRMEVLVAFFNALLLIGIVFGIGFEAVERLRSPAPVQGGTVMLVATLGLAVNLLVAYLLSRGEENLNTRAALLHVMGDVLGSIAALTAGLVIYLTGWMLIDPILSLVISVLILLSTLRLLREVLHVLLEGVPLNLNLEEVGQAMARTGSVQSVHDLHIWALSSGSVALSAHVVMPDMQHWPSSLEALREMLHTRFDIDHVTLQPEIHTFPMLRGPYTPMAQDEHAHHHGHHEH